MKCGNRPYVGTMSYNEHKRTALKQIGYYLFRYRNIEKCRALMFTGSRGSEIDLWRKQGLLDANMILADRDLWRLIIAKSENNVTDAFIFPYPFTKENVEKHLITKNWKPLDAIHFDTTSNLDGCSNEYTIGKILEAISTPRLIKKGSRIAITFVRGHDRNRNGKSAKQIADKEHNGDRICVLHSRIIETTKKKIRRVASGEYNNGSNGQYPMAWAVFEVN